MSSILKTFVADSLIRIQTIAEDRELLNALSEDAEETNPDRITKWFNPSVRAAYVRVYYKNESQDQQFLLTSNEQSLLTTNSISIELQDAIRDTIIITRDCQLKPILGIKTNLLIDAIPYSPFGISFMPNIQAELYTHIWNLSVEFAYTFPWFKNDAKHKYFQIINGTLGVRKYFRSDYTGLYVGVYGNTGYYDLCINADKGW